MEQSSQQHAGEHERREGQPPPAAQASSTPVATPGARIQPNVPDQDTADSGPAIWVMKPRSEAAQARPRTAPIESRGRSEPLRLGMRCDRTVRAGALLATLVSSAVELDPGKGHRPEECWTWSRARDIARPTGP